MKPLKKLNGIINDDEQNTRLINSNSVTTTSSSTNNAALGISTNRIVQNFCLVWLNTSSSEMNYDVSMNSIAELRQVINTLNRFTDVDECIDFITDIKDEKVFMIYSGEASETTTSIIHEITQITCIYIYSENQTQYEHWIEIWPKIKGVFTNTTAIGTALKNDIEECDHNTVSISFVKKTSEGSKKNLNQLDSSFMYTQILKEILLTINFEPIHFSEFLNYCREQFNGNHTELRNIDKIEREYDDHQPIWWYTYNCFLYSMLNRALRLMEIDLIIKMGFFLKDLHLDITALYTEQFSEYSDLNSFIVYRGQGLPEMDFDELKQTQGGLLSFNNFLSTSKSRDVSLNYARRTIRTTNLIGILFIIEVDPTVSSAPFTNIKNVSFYKREEEILFSMHSVFRIGAVEQIDGNDRLCQVDLRYTSDKDPQLHILMECIRQETYPNLKGWHRLVELLIKLGQFDKAQQVCDIMLNHSSNQRERADIYHMIGIIKYHQRNYVNAVEYHEKSLKIKLTILSPTHIDLAASYNNLALVHEKMKENLKALWYYEKAVEIDQKHLPEKYPHLATAYNNIGLVYQKMDDYSKALSYYEKALEIYFKTLPNNHPLLATAYSNIGSIYNIIEQYSRALSYYEKALDINQNILPENHPDLATSYNSIGLVCENMEEYSKALSYYKKALDINQNIFPENQPDLAPSYNNIALLYAKVGEYSKALLYYEKVLEIYQKIPLATDPLLAISYNGIGLVCNNMGEYSKAVLFHEKALEIYRSIPPENHLDLAVSYNNIGLAYDNMKEYSEALTYYEKALEISQKTLPRADTLLATCYSNIGSTYSSMGEYSKAYSYYERALDILQHSLPSEHPCITTVRQNMEFIKKTL